jgi:hypothetical protein
MRIPLPPVPDGPVTAWDRFGIGLLGLCGAFAGLLEVLLVPLYAGATVLPVSVLLALISNAVLPWLARALVPSTAAALTPLGTWLLVAVGFGAFGRPEGDVILPGAPSAVEYVTYAVLLGGTVAGTASVVMFAPPPTGRPPLR